MVSAGGGGELSERPRLHANYRVQAPDRPTTSPYQCGVRVSFRDGRSVLPDSAPGKRGALCEVSRPGGDVSACSLRWAPRNLSLLQHGPGGRAGPDPLQKTRGRGCDTPG